MLNRISFGMLPPAVGQMAASAPAAPTLPAAQPDTVSLRFGSQGPLNQKQQALADALGNHGKDVKSLLELRQAFVAYAGERLYNEAKALLNAGEEINEETSSILIMKAFQDVADQLGYPALGDVVALDAKARALEDKYGDPSKMGPLDAFAALFEGMALMGAVGNGDELQAEVDDFFDEVAERMELDVAQFDQTMEKLFLTVEKNARESGPDQ